MRENSVPFICKTVTHLGQVGPGVAGSPMWSMGSRPCEQFRGSEKVGDPDARVSVAVSAGYGQRQSGSALAWRWARMGSSDQSWTSM